MNLKLLGINIPKEIFGFALYDFSNSAYILIFNAYLFPLFLKEKVVSDSNNVDLVWSVALTISLITALLVTPIISKRADFSNRKRLLRIFISLTSIGLSCLTFLPYNTQSLFLAYFIFTNICFTISLSLYDSLLNHITEKENRNKVSGFAWGFGYLGGVICLLFVLGLTKVFPNYPRIGFLFTALYYISFSFFSLRLMSGIKEKVKIKENNTSSLRINYTKYILLLLGIWLMCEGIDVVIYFSSLFASSTLNLTKTDIGKLLLLVQLLAFPLTLFLTKRANKIGALKLLNITIGIWLIIILGLFFATSISNYIVLTILTAFVIGTSQSLLRGEFSKIIPDESSSWYFSFFSIAMRSANFLGPLIFGILSTVTGNQRMGFLVVAIFFVIGITLYNTNYNRLLGKK